MIPRPLGDLPVLAKTAAQVAAHRGNGIGKRSGMKMEQRLFFDGINFPGNHFVINQGIQLSLMIVTDATGASCPVWYVAVMGAQRTPDLILLQRLVITGFFQIAHGFYL
jgi:hypothetical protein